MTVWDQHVTAALLLMRNVRLQAVMQGIDARAFRVALKYLLMIDTECMKKRGGLSEEEDEKLTALARDLFKKTPRW